MKTPQDELEQESYRIRENPSNRLRITGSPARVIGEVLIPVAANSFEFTAIKPIVDGDLKGIAILYSDRENRANYDTTVGSEPLRVPIDIPRSQLGNPAVNSQIRVMCLNEYQSSITGYVESFFIAKLRRFGLDAVSCEQEGEFIVNQWNHNTATNGGFIVYSPCFPFPTEQPRFSKKTDGILRIQP